MREFRALGTDAKEPTKSENVSSICGRHVCSPQRGRRISVRKYVVAAAVVVFLETISESLGDPHTSHQVQETEAGVTNLLFIVTTLPGVYTAHSIL